MVKKMIKRIIKRISVGLLAASLAFSSLSVNAFSAVTTRKVEADYLIDNEKEARAAYDALNQYYKSGKAEDGVKAYLLINALTPTQRVHFYLLRYAQVYKDMVKSGDYSVFDPEKYLTNNPDVYAYAKASNEEPVSYALDHYLSEGVFQGRSSCTDFDPVVAIVAYPQETIVSLVQSKKAQPSDLLQVYTAFVENSGDFTTKDYELASLIPVNEGKVSQNVDNYDLEIIKRGGKNQKNPQVTDTEEKPSPEGRGEESDTPAPSPISTPEPTPEPSPTPRAYTPLNAKAASAITPYSLYVDAQGTGVQEVDNGEGGLKGVFFPETYQSVIASGAVSSAKVTLMYYICGSDLESRLGCYSMLIEEIIKSGYDPSKVNVLVCTGGCSRWLNPDINYGQYGCADLKLNVYYLDPTACTSSQVEEGEEEADLNTEDALKLLGHYDSINMGDPAILTGFMDMAYELFPAQSYCLQMNNHGGGINGGICFSASKGSQGEEGYIEGDSLTMYELEQALGSSKIYTYGDGLENIYMDACLMGATEIAYNLSPYAKYLTASEKTSYTNVESGRSAKIISDAISGNEYDGRSVAISLSKANLEAIQGGYQDDVVITNAAIDLSAVKDLATYVNALGEELSAALKNENMKTDVYRALRAASLTSDNAGFTSDYLDINDFTYKLRTNIFTYCTNTDPDYRDQIDRINQALDNVRDQGYIMYAGAYRDGEICFDAEETDGSPFSISQVEGGEFYQNFWALSKKRNMYSGTSIYFPAAGFDASADQEYTDQNLWSEYVTALCDFKDIKAGGEEQARVKNTAGFIYGKDTSSKLFDEKTNDGMVTYSMADSEYIDDDEKKDIKNIQVTFSYNYTNEYKNQYVNAGTESEEREENDLTEPYVDFASGTGEAAVVLTNKQKDVTIEDGRVVAENTLDMIIGRQSFDLYKNVKTITESESGISQSGVTIEATSYTSPVSAWRIAGIGTHTVALQGDPESAAYSDWGYNRNGDYENEYLAEALGLNASYVKAFEGFYNYREEGSKRKFSEAYLVFYGAMTAFPMDYVGAVRRTYDEENDKYIYTKVEDSTVTNVGFYHYVLETSDSGEVKTVNVELSTDKELNAPIYTITYNTETGKYDCCPQAQEYEYTGEEFVPADEEAEQSENPNPGQLYLEFTPLSKISDNEGTVEELLVTGEALTYQNSDLDVAVGEEIILDDVSEPEEQKELAAAAKMDGTLAEESVPEDSRVEAEETAEEMVEEVPAVETEEEETEKTEESEETKAALPEEDTEEVEESEETKAGLPEKNTEEAAEETEDTDSKENAEEVVEEIEETEGLKPEDPEAQKSDD